MADENTRDLERDAASGDLEARARLLWERVRCDALTLEQVDLAASLGHPEAMAARPEVRPLKWVYDLVDEGLSEETPAGSMTASILLASETLGREGLARVAADWAEKSLPDWDTWDPPGAQYLWAGWAPRPRPQEAIAATRAWATCRSSDRSMAAEAAADAAEAAAEEAYVAFHRVLAASPMTPADAARVEWCERFSSASYAAWNAAYAAVEDSVADAVSAVKGAAQRAWRSASDPEAESNWQKLQLAAYVLDTPAR